MKTWTNSKKAQPNSKKPGLKVRTGIKAGPSSTGCPSCFSRK